MSDLGIRHHSVAGEWATGAPSAPQSAADAPRELLIMYAESRRASHLAMSAALCSGISRSMACDWGNITTCCHGWHQAVSCCGPFTLSAIYLRLTFLHLCSAACQCISSQIAQPSPGLRFVLNDTSHKGRLGKRAECASPRLVNRSVPVSLDSMRFKSMGFQACRLLPSWAKRRPKLASGRQRWPSSDRVSYF